MAGRGPGVHGEHHGGQLALPVVVRDLLYRRSPVVVGLEVLRRRGEQLIVEGELPVPVGLDVDVHVDPLQNGNVQASHPNTLYVRFAQASMVRPAFRWSAFVRAAHCTSRPRCGTVCDVEARRQVREGDLLWMPGPDRVDRANVTSFIRWLGQERGRHFGDYQELWRWSVTDLDGFWQAVWDYCGIAASAPPTAVLGTRTMPGADWFPGARLNYAQHVLRNERPGQAGTRERRAHPGHPAARHGRPARRPGGLMHAEHPADRDRDAGHDQHRRHLDQLLPRLRRPRDQRPVRPAGPEGPALRGQLPLRGHQP